MSRRKHGETQAAERLAALGNVTRLKLFRLLVRAGKEGLTVGTIQRHLAVPPSTLAHHLAALARVELIRQERSGREVICTADYEAMRDLVGYLAAECCAGVEQRDDDAA